MEVKNQLPPTRFILENDNFDKFIESVNNVFLIFLFNLDREIVYIVTHHSVLLQNQS